MNPVELQSQVLGVLENFSGVAPMKKLFWTLLNYDQVNKPISRRGWPDTASTVLQEDPLVLASGGEKNDFHVVYSRLAKDRLLLADERLVTTRLLKDHPYGLFVFSDRTQTNWHFLNVQMAEEEEKRKLYRRVAVGPNEKMRTACQVISQLDLASINATLFGLSPLVIQERHDQAFDVEPVTEEFYRTYHSIFDTVKGLIKGFKNDERKHLFTQRLFNRLMFIAFIQKKGWLQFGGKKNQDYLNALWADYKKNGSKDMGFYYERLYNLFFHGLGAQDDVGIIKINRGGLLRDVIGSVPYLNGGLFEEDDDDKDGGIKVPDDALKTILHNLFDHFNFTVTEATPLDVEVAVDPEMLGKVFEELVTGRHETGSYYTPKPIVSFMCREALKGYLESNLPKEKPDAIASFVDQHEPLGLRDAEAVLEALRRVRCCDPACGSGAYLLGMLHELMDLRTCLFTAKRIDPVSAYDRKLEIIQRNIYGVDLDPFAVNIARLRLWLSLAVEFEADDPPPLPNLKFEIEEGDSLAAPGPDPNQAVMWADEIRKFGETKAKYIKAHGEKKRSLETEVERLKASIASWTHHGQSVSGFDWAVEFAEVFQDGGFDIAVANPPYVRMELFKDQKPMLRTNFPSVHAERADLYCYFYARSLEILKSSGMLSFISPNKWFKANYGANLRRLIADSCRINTIVDFGELPVFKAATFPMIFIAKKDAASSGSTVFTQVTSLNPPYPDVLSLIKADGAVLSPDSIKGEVWNFAVGKAASVLDKLRRGGIPLSEYVNGEIFRGIVSGMNKAFIIDEATRRELRSIDPQSDDSIKPFLVGDNMRKWKINWPHEYLLYTYHGIEKAGLKPILQRMKQFRTQLEARAGKQEWYELQQPQWKYVRYFKQPKIVFPDIAKSSRFAFDRKGHFVDSTGFLIPRDDLYLLGVLNSTAVWRFLSETAAVLGDPRKGGRLRLKRIYVEQIPIPIATTKAMHRIATLAEGCLQKSGEDCLALEEELDGLVAGLYGMEPADLIIT